MWLQFFSQNAHFAINLLTFLVCLAVGWLYFDAWSNKRQLKELLKWVGFGALGLSFLVSATSIEQSVLGNSLFGSLSSTLMVTLRLIGYAGIIAGNLIDPLQVVPKLKGLDLGEADEDKKDKTAKQNMVSSGGGLAAKALLPLGGLAVAGLYWRRATTGLERHLKPVALAFVFIALSDFFSLGKELRDTTDPLLYNRVAAFGVVWWISLVCLLAGTYLLGRWVWSYLTKRFLSQLFIIFTTSTVVIFLAVSVVFTALLLRTFRSNELDNLHTAAQVLNYGINAKQAEATAGAEELASRPDIAAAVASKDHKALVDLTKDYLVNKKQSELLVLNDSGQVLLRASDTERWGDSLSDDSLVRRALLGTNQAGLTTSNSVYPTINMRSAVAIRDSGGDTKGAVLSSVALDSAFVDGVKKSTGLQSSLFAGSTLTATTFLNSDGKTRALGTKLSDNNLKNSVLKQGNDFSGGIRFQNRQMFASALPLKDVDNSTVGMLLISEPQSSALRASGRSVELTFVFTSLLLVVSVVPLYLISKGLVRQIG